MDRKLLSQVAVFDIDGTIFRSSLMEELNRGLVEAGVFVEEVVKEYEAPYFAWLNREGSYEDYIYHLVQAFDKAIVGVLVEDLKRVTWQVIEALKNRVYRYSRDILRDWRPNYRLLAISHSPVEIVEAFNRYWRFDWVSGTEYFYQDGKYTGEKNFRENKSAVLKEYLNEERLSAKGSIGVGDTALDIGFLKIVEKAIAFNPNMELMLAAKEDGWEIVVERKDVIYRIENGCLL